MVQVGIRVRSSVAVLALIGAVAASWPTAAADRAVAWIRVLPNGLERELNAQAARGLRLAAVSDGLPACSIIAMQAPASAGAPAEYRVVADRDVGAEFDRLVGEGFVPRASARSLSQRVDVIFERIGATRVNQSWRLVEFEKVEDLPTALASAAGEGYRASALLRPAFRSWPGLSARGLVLVSKAAGAGALDVQVHFVSKRNVDELAKAVTAATGAGWQFDLLFAHTRDGAPAGRRERAAVVLSKPRNGSTASTPVTIDRESAPGILGDVVLGAAGYWNEVLVASVDAERRQAWATPIRLDGRDAECSPLGFGFASDAPRDLAWSITALVAKPAATAGAYDLLVITDQDMRFR